MALYSAPFSTELILVGFLLMIRIGVVLRFAPFFGGGPMPILPFVALSASLSILLAPTNIPISLEFEPTPFYLGALALKELFIGIVIGVMTRLAFAVFEITGGLVNVASLSFRRAVEQDGLGGTPLQTFYPLLGTTIFLLLGGHHALLSGIAGTFGCMPLTTLPPIDALGDTASLAVLRLFTSAIAAAVLISAPIFIAGLAAETITGIMLRITGGTAQSGTQLARVFAVCLIAIATLGMVLENGIDFLSNSLNEASICGKLSP